MGRWRYVKFEDGTYGWVRVERTRIRIPAYIREYINLMFDALEEWLEDEVWYDEPEEMLEDAEEHIYEKLWYAPEDKTPCDNGVLSTRMFVNYVLDGELLDVDDIEGYILEWIYDPEYILPRDINDIIEAVNCYEELLAFRRALKSIKVKVVEGGGG
jgi:hypothetical protein